MKALLRSAPAQALFAFVLAGYLGFALRTIRWKRQGLEIAERVWDSGGPAIVCFWHSRIGLSPACWDLKRGQTPRALISRSADGALTATIMERLGFPAIRGSARDPNKPEKEKGGVQALREMLKWLKGHRCVAVTPDGPRGPVEEVGPGPPLLARLSKAPVLFVGLAARPCIRLRSWDRGIIPLPFTRGAIIYQGPEAVDADADLDRLRADWTERLKAVTAAAEAALA